MAEKKTVTKNGEGTNVGFKDTQSRKYQLTINNPLECDPPYTHGKIKEELKSLASLVYYCMADEKGLAENTPHTHVYTLFSSPVRFSTLKKRFPTAHIESAYGTSKSNRDYIGKEGKWKSSQKSETSVPGTFEEWGAIPANERINPQGELHFILDLVESGYTSGEIVRIFPESIRYLDKIDFVRQLLKEEEYKNTWRELETTYVYGATQTNKTRSIMEEYGYPNVFRVIDYKHPFDKYYGQSVLLFEEFRSSIEPIGQMLNYLDGYPCELSARYHNKTACYLKVYITSNLPLEQQYQSIQEREPETWKAFLRRIHRVLHHIDADTVKEYTVQEYFEHLRLTSPGADKHPGTGRQVRLPYKD